jgi:hypothetical protein
MGRPWPKPTLVERSGRSPVDDRRRAPVHHCWVEDAAEPPGRHAGLLLEWRRDDERWMGLVAYVVQEAADGGVRLVQRWVPAALLAPITGE